LTEEFSRLKSHFLFRAALLPGPRPNEKGHVEGMVGFNPAELSRAGSLAESWEALNVALEEAVPAGP